MGESADVISDLTVLRNARTVLSKPEYKSGVRNFSKIIRMPRPRRFVSIFILFLKVGFKRNMTKTAP